MKINFKKFATINENKNLFLKSDYGITSSHKNGSNIKELGLYELYIDLRDFNGE